PPVPLQRPAEDVVAVDARTLALRGTGERERIREPDPVVDLEERDLEVGAHAVRGEELADGAHERVLALRGGGTPRDAVELAARVRGAWIRGEPRLEPHHPVEAVEGLAVAAQLDERVADDSEATGLDRVGRARGRPERDRAAPEA